MKNRKKPYKKTQQMLQYYRKSIKETNIETEDTVKNDSINLESSDIPSEISADEIPIEYKSYALKLKDWLVKNWIPVFFVGAILLLFQWGIDAKVNISEIKTRLEYLDTAVQKLDDSYSRKEEVKLEMENIKNLIDNNDNDFKEIKDRLIKVESIINN